MSNRPASLYDTVVGKAQKYGSPDLPLVIAVWALDYPSKTEEGWALYGNDQISWLRDRRGRFVSGSERVGTTNDGVFMAHGENGNFRFTKVSSVVFYQFAWGEGTPQHTLRVYHNRFADKALPLKVFERWPQHIGIDSGRGTLELRWLKHPWQLGVFWLKIVYIDRLLHEVRTLSQRLLQR